MRKRISVLILAALFILAAVFVLSFSACAKRQTQSVHTPYSAAWDGKVYTVTPIDNDKGTISDGTNTYSYRYEADGSGYSVTFTYPDGETYKCSDSGTGAAFTSGASSLEFDYDEYPDGMTLKHLLEQAPSAKSEKRSTKNVGLIFFLLVIGGINTAWPQAAWYLDVGWKVKDAEPSEAALTWNRGVGVVVLIIAVIMMIA